MQGGKAFLQLFPACRLFRQLFFRGKLCLSNLLYEDPAHLHIGKIPVLDDFFFDLLDELRLHRLPLFCSQLRHGTWIRFQQTLEYRVVTDEVHIHLELILFIEGQRRILLLDGVANLVIAFHELPQLVAGTVIGILHHQVGPLDRASYPGAAVHNIAERACPQHSCQTAHTIDPFEDIHVIRVILHGTLPVFNTHLHPVGNFLVGIIHLGLHAHNIAGLVPGGPEDHVGALVHKRKQTLDQMIHKPVFIQVIAFLDRAVEDMGRLDLTSRIGSDKPGVLA